MKFKILVILFFSFTLLLVACSKESTRIQSIEIDTTTLKEVYDIDEFDLSSIYIKVHYHDGHTEIIAVNDSMINSGDNHLLNSIGSHTIFINYGDISIPLDLNLQYSELKTVMMAIYNLSVTQSAYIGPMMNG